MMRKGFKCDAAHDILKEEEEACACLWSQDDFEFDTTCDMLKEEEDADTCSWLQDGFECDTALDMLKEDEQENAFLWSEDEFELCTLCTLCFDTIDKEEDDDACFGQKMDQNMILPLRNGQSKNMLRFCFDQNMYDTATERLKEEDDVDAG